MRCKILDICIYLCLKIVICLGHSIAFLNLIFIAALVGFDQALTTLSGVLWLIPQLLTAKMIAMSKITSTAPPAIYCTGISIFLDLLFFLLLEVLGLVDLLLPFTLRMPVLELPVLFVSSADLLMLDFDVRSFGGFWYSYCSWQQFLLPLFNVTYSFSMMI